MNDDADRWLEGLAGRPGSGAAHAEGQRLRAALEPDAGGSMQPAWAEIEARARQDAVLAGQAEARAPAANRGRFRPMWAWAASVLLGLGVLFAVFQSPDEALRGVGPAGATAQWVVASPAERAKELADELVGLGAQVSLGTDASAVLLIVDVAAEHRGAVNQRLAALETSLDAQGHLLLAVRSPALPPPASEGDSGSGSRR